MASKIRLADGREITVALSGKRVVEALQQRSAEDRFVQFSTAARAKVWVSPEHVAAVEDRPDLD